MNGPKPYLDLKEIQVLVSSEKAANFSENDVRAMYGLLSNTFRYVSSGKIGKNQRLLLLILGTYYIAKNKRGRSISVSVRRLCEACDAIVAHRDEVTAFWSGSLHKRLQSLTYYLVLEHGLLAFKKTRSRSRADGLMFALGLRTYVDYLNSEEPVDLVKLVEVIDTHRARTGEIQMTRILHHYMKDVGICSLESLTNAINKFVDDGSLRKVVVRNGKSVLSVDYYLTRDAYWEYKRRQEREPVVKEVLGSVFYECLSGELKNDTCSMTPFELQAFAERVVRKGLK